MAFRLGTVPVGFTKRLVVNTGKLHEDKISFLTRLAVIVRILPRRLLANAKHVCGSRHVVVLLSKSFGAVAFMLQKTSVGTRQKICF